MAKAKDSKFYHMSAPDGENSSGYKMSASDGKDEGGQPYDMNSDGDKKSMKE